MAASDKIVCHESKQTGGCDRIFRLVRCTHTQFFDSAGSSERIFSVGQVRVNRIFLSGTELFGWAGSSQRNLSVGHVNGILLLGGFIIQNFFGLAGRSERNFSVGRVRANGIFLSGFR